MRPRRIYLALDCDRLRALAADRVLAAPSSGFAPGAPDARLATSSAAAGEEAEYLAFVAAATAAGEPARTGESRRVVAAADVPAEALRELDVPGQAGGPVAVETTEDLPLRLVVSLHIDEALAAAAGEESDLLWYDITELDVVLEELGLST